MSSDYVFPLVILPSFFCIYIAASIVTTFFHELGHAVPALLFTTDKVTVFLGSYGDSAKSVHLKIGKRLHIYFRLNLFTWRKGMVTQHSASLSFYKKLIILLSGPLFSSVIAAIAVWMIFSFDLNGFLKLISVIFFFSAIIDLRNIFPSNIPVILSDGSLAYNDGYQILKLIKFNKESERLSKAYFFYNNKNYVKAIYLFENLSLIFITNDILKVVLSAYHNVKDYQGGKKFYEKTLDMQVGFTPDADNFCLIGLIENSLENNELAIHYYNQSLQLIANHVYSLSNRGFTHSILGRYEQAIADFDSILSVETEFAYAFANRGYAKIKLNLMEEGLRDISRSLEIDDKNSYAYRNLGLYHYDRNDYDEARRNFKMAFELDPNTHLINQYIKMLENKMVTDT